MPKPPQPFRPAVEVVIHDRPSRTNTLIDLDTGKLHALPQLTGGDEDLAAWCRQNGIDGWCQRQGDYYEFRALDLTVAEGKRINWGMITPPVLRVELEGHEPAGDRLLESRGKLPTTWFFRTREGAEGVLQVLGRAANPNGVRIRFRIANH